MVPNVVAVPPWKRWAITAFALLQVTATGYMMWLDIQNGKAYLTILTFVALGVTLVGWGLLNFFSWERRFDRATDKIVCQRRAEGKIP